MKINNIFNLILVFLLFFSCSKKEIKESIIKEKSLDLQVYEAYVEGKKSLENGDVLFAAKNLMKQKFYFLNLSGHQNLP